MPDTVAGIREVARRLRGRGVDVREVPGWETRGRGTLTPRGFVAHHTAGAQAGGRYASLRIVTHGRTGLRNALSNFYRPRGPGREVWVVAARVAWHAGRGGWLGLTGNSSVLGLECENDGVGEPWHPDLLADALDLEVACADVFGFQPQFRCEHREWAPSRKIDRTGIDGQTIRDKIAHRLQEPPQMTPDTVVYVHPRQGVPDALLSLWRTLGAVTGIVLTADLDLVAQQDRAGRTVIAVGGPAAGAIARLGGPWPGLAGRGGGTHRDGHRILVRGETWNDTGDRLRQLLP